MINPCIPKQSPSEIKKIKILFVTDFLRRRGEGLYLSSMPEKAPSSSNEQFSISKHVFRLSLSSYNVSQEIMES